MDWSESNWEFQVLNAEITISYKTMQEAEAVAKALIPDNVKAPRGLIIRTIRQGTKVLTMIECTTKLLTFLATIDDVMSAVSVAERSVSTVRDF